MYLDIFATIDDADDRKARAKKLYEIFVNPNSLRAANLSHGTIKAVESLLTAPPKNAFAKAKEEVLNFLERDIFPDFLVEATFPSLETLYRQKKRPRGRSMTAYDLVVKKRKELAATVKTPPLESLFQKKDLCAVFRDFLYYRHRYIYP